MGLNKDFQTEQMEIIVHYFHEDRVVTQYFDSQFMRHTTASDLCKRLKCSLSKLNNRKLFLISMGGPRVNWKLLSLYGEDKKEDTDLPKLLNVGSYGLCIVLQLSVQDARLQIGKQKNSSEHYGIWSMIYQQEGMTMQQWLGQQSFLWNSVHPNSRRWQSSWKSFRNLAKCRKIHQTCIEGIKEQKPSASYSTIQKVTKDVLVPAKLQVFVYISKVLKPFLVKY